MFNQLKEECLKCIKCDLSKTRKNVVFGSGPENAEILFIGEAPGANEDIEGKPFVGKAGQDLNKYLTIANIERDKVFIANILKCRPPENRNPNIDEIKVCTPWLIEQIKVINPKIICTLGNFATKFILSSCNTDKINQIAGITKLHGKLQNMTFNGKSYKVFPLFHPAALIYNQYLKPQMEQDMKMLKELLNGKESSQPSLNKFF
ncbi:uracil-DNA glycosylase [Candidatus Woesearchaeota archaeon]|nr:uracil-DNA glycosylase [Candidatus Woesearchaeota archaeon]